ncbi:MAG: hypothetical protein HY873_06065 [Chloroflexi bacterium]|nr:hypothetical protein [Chloroflexota bacterium]
MADDYGRSESLARSSFENGGGGTYLSRVTGRQATGWAFTYESGDDETEHLKIAAITGVVNYNVDYDPVTKMAVVCQTTGLADPYIRTFGYTVDAQTGGATAVTINEPFGGTTAYAINPAADAWTSMTNAEGIATARTLDAAKRQISDVTTGRYHETFGYDGVGNLTSRAVSGGTTSTWTYSDFGIDGANLLATSALSGAGTTAYTYFTDMEFFLVLSTTTTFPTRSQRT